jgi:type 1 glutamine amidotransferase
MLNNTFFLRFLILLILYISGQPNHAQSVPVHVLVVTGGHDYNVQTFNEMFTSMQDPIAYETAVLPEAFTLLEPENRSRYDVLVFYHMWQDITREQQENLADCIREGKPLVVLHHSICAFDDWDEYRRIIGGKYFHRQDTIDGKIYPPSSYTHDVSVTVTIRDKNHPVTKGIHDFELFDETYDNFYVEPDATPLLLTKTPGSSPVIGWTKQFGNARVVILQSGHDTPTYQDPNYRKLLRQAIEWVYQGKSCNH